jgi:hypothetical protein
MFGKQIHDSQLLLWLVLVISGLTGVTSTIGHKDGANTLFLPQITTPPLNLELVTRLLH